jgi:hypothetical protein
MTRYVLQLFVIVAIVVGVATLIDLLANLVEKL